MNNQTKVVIVQHPREEFHPLNTARIAEHSLDKVTVVRAPTVGRMPEAFARAQVSPDAAILYPSSDAEDIESIPESQFPQEIIVIDGTWHHAKALLRDIPELSKFRRVRFTPNEPSEYKIRKEPKADYLSTIESIAYVLSVLEPQTAGVEGLRETFRSMIDRNIQARKPAEQGMRVRIRKERKHRFPAALHQEASRLVVLYAEGTRRLSAMPAQNGQPGSLGTPKEALVLQAQRFCDEGNDAIECIVKTEATPPARLLENLHLTIDDVNGRGQEPAEVARQLKAWLKPDDIIVAWNASSLAIARELGISMCEPLLLKGAYCDWQNFVNQRRAHLAGETLVSEPSSGGMHGIVEREEISWSQPVSLGRAPLRLAQTRAVLGWMREQAAEHCVTLDS